MSHGFTGPCQSRTRTIGCLRTEPFLVRQRAVDLDEVVAVRAAAVVVEVLAEEDEGDDGEEVDDDDAEQPREQQTPPVGRMRVTA